MPSPNDYLVLSRNCFLKDLEEPCVYNIATDELYETNAEAFDFLKLCDGSRRVRDLRFEAPFLGWCLDEGVITPATEPSKRKFVPGKSPRPSLRYLELQITARCNLKCRHCYLGTAKPVDLTVEDIVNVLGEFERMQGLRLIISGGEPLLHPDFWSINDMLPRFGFRSILLSNGALIDSGTARKLNVHEVQISLDGMEPAHDYLRGKGSFVRAVSGIRELRRLNKDVSVATMVHARNLEDFPALEKLVKEISAKEWNVDVPCAEGNLTRNRELLVPDPKAAQFLRYGFGGGLYASSPGYACGAHLCAVTPEGKVAKCGFFSNQPVGDVREGLENCWNRLPHLRLEELECECRVKEDCRGGCRYRALLEKDMYAPDPVQCYFRGIRKAA